MPEPREIGIAGLDLVDDMKGHWEKQLQLARRSSGGLFGGPS
jgi:hypothetical protein